MWLRQELAQPHCLDEDEPCDAVVFTDDTFGEEFLETFAKVVPFLPS